MKRDTTSSENIGVGKYSRHRRNPLLIHAALDSKSPLGPEHFHRWLTLFTETIDESFAGTRAAFAEQRGETIAQRMQEYIGGMG